MNVLRRFLPWAVGLASAAPVLLGSSSALAQESLDAPFSEGFSLQTLWPAPAGDWFFAAPDAAVGETYVHAMAFGSWAFSPPLVRIDSVTAEKRRVNKYQFYLHADVSLAIKERVMVNLDIPFVPYQDGQVGAPNEPGGGVLADPRLGARLNLVGHRNDPIALALGVDAWLPIGSEEELAGDGEFRINPKLLVSGRLGPVIYALSGGYLHRKEFNSGSLEIGPSATMSGGLGVLLAEDKLQLGAELYASTLLNPELGEPLQQRTTPGGALFGLKYRAGDIVLGAALGPGLSQTPGSATRGVLSVAYSPGHEPQADLGDEWGDTDSDGIVNELDACPEDPGPMRPESDKARIGCPKLYFDFDNDGIPDWRDHCPTVAGFARSGGPTENGCPEPDLDTDGDGVVDEYDACPDEAGGAGTGGCPAHAVRPDGQHEIVITSAQVVRLDDGTERVVIELSGPVELSSSGAGTSVRYQLNDVKITADTRNRLGQRRDDPDSALVGVTLEPLEGRLIVHVAMRGGAREPKMRYHTDLKGGAVLYVDLPRRWQR
ncbi:MAG: thrombospondin type 3 repeat-containing protein [Polyangiaceae bacterium]|nr:thrombospondin type 3 repeat-containing protein [Polyangiaceae bacterium]MCW5789236.1 thrombospondin type 3 repeat-containing protein [Polyangiaceae bacterium]